MLIGGGQLILNYSQWVVTCFYPLKLSLVSLLFLYLLMVYLRIRLGEEVRENHSNYSRLMVY